VGIGERVRYRNGDGISDIQPDWGPDTTKPEITLTTPAEGATYTLNESVTADYECADEGGSGLKSCEGDVADGALIDTGSVGSKTFTVTATDNGGNTSSVSHTYSVIYDFNGFLSPVDNPPTLNLVKAGSVIPVNFSLSGDQGLDVFADGYPTPQKIACDTGVSADPVEETLSANESSLTYDASSDQYTYAWKTNKAWAGNCRQLVVKLKDGTEHLANFEFK